jgi:hypothetical protein
MINAVLWQHVHMQKQSKMAIVKPYPAKVENMVSF